jgi:hypothetical protein
MTQRTRSNRLAAVVLLLTITFAALSLSLAARQPSPRAPDDGDGYGEAAKGKNLLTTRSYSLDEDRALMLWKTRGAVGVVTSGGARDTDEIIKEKIPLYFRVPGRGIRPGRNEVESVNRPVTVGGVLVRPGDVVVADGDGVIVVPREQAAAVARAARAVLEGDKAARRKLYEKLGLPADSTVAPSNP